MPGLSSGQDEEETPGRRCDLPRPPVGGDTRVPFDTILLLEPGEDSPNTIVEHRLALRPPRRQRRRGRIPGTLRPASNAGSVIGMPVSRSNREPCRGQTTTHASGSQSPSASGPSSCEHRSSMAKSDPPQLKTPTVIDPAGTRRILPGGSSSSGQTSNSATDPYSSTRSLTEAPHSSGSGVPLALWSASLRTPRPRIAHLRRTGVSGMPSSSRSSSLRIAATS